MTAALLRPPAWTTHAHCPTSGLHPEHFDRGTPAARAICANCPVQLDCALDALERAEPNGMWGGLNPDDRTDIARRFAYLRPGTPDHGTRARYGHRTHPCRCDKCTEAMRRWKRDYTASRSTSPARDVA